MEDSIEKVIPVLFQGLEKKIEHMFINDLIYHVKCLQAPEKAFDK